VNDAFKAVTRYWDRIALPEQIIGSLPQAVAAMLDPADCGPAFLSLCQDTQEVAYDYPEAFFTPTVWSIPRPRPDRERLAAAVELLRSARKPLIISGGGTRYSLAEGTVAQFALDRGIPISETIAGKGAVTHEHPAHVGPIGILGSTSANALAAEADVVLAIGTRLMDFTTGSWTVFNHDARIIGINAARWDATKHRSSAVVGDARETVAELDAALGDWKAPASWTSNARKLIAEWNELLDQYQKPTNAPVPTYAQVIATVHAAAGPTDPIITAAGGLPAWATRLRPAGATPWRGQTRLQS
jgi:3D-(3,5/4)-trihydroxycyclohexane-1,2-dione acylhydrolase (decyclizing)